MCILYGGTVLAAAVSASFIFLLISTNVGWASLILIYFFTSVLTSIFVFGLRSRRKGLDRTKNPFELGIGLISAIGFSLPLTLMGIFMVSFAEHGFLYSNNQPAKLKDLESEIQKAVTELELSQESRNASMELLGEIRDKKLLRGREPEEIAGAIIYIVSRDNDEPRTLDEVSQVVNTGKREIGKAYRNIGRNTDVQILPPQPSDFIDRFTEKLGLSEDVNQLAHLLVEEGAEKNFTSGMSPTGIAAAAVYLAAYIEDEKRTMNETSEILDVTTVTIRERSKDFIKELGIEKYPEHLAQ